MAWLIGIGIAFVVLVVSLVIVLAIRDKNKKELEAENNPTLINLCQRWVKKYAYGTQKYVETGKDGRKIYTIGRRDVSPMNIEKVDEEEKIIVKKGFDLHIPKGVLSTDKDIIFLLPPRAEDLPEQLKGTDFGKIMQKYIENKDSDNTETDSLREGLDRAKNHMQKHASGEASAEQLENIENWSKAAIESVIKDTQKDQSKSPGYPQSQH